MMHRKLIAIIGIIFIYSCSSTNAYKSTNKLYKSQSKAMAKEVAAIPKAIQVSDSTKVPPHWVGTTNFGLRKPSYVIIHHTAQESCEKTLATFTKTNSQVSAHYTICKDGTLQYMLNNYLRAWHAGNSKWGNMTDINSSSIGIEIDNNGLDTFTNAQINVLLGLLAHLKDSFKIPTANFIGHSDIAPKRKVDPNVNFPWKLLADKGFGHWYADTSGLQLPAYFDSKTALRIIGYDVSDLIAASEAFRRHFISSNNKGLLANDEKKILYRVMEKFL